MTPEDGREIDERYAHTLVELRRTAARLRVARDNIKRYNDECLEHRRLIFAHRKARRLARERNPLRRFGRWLVRLFGGVPE